MEINVTAHTMTLAEKASPNSGEYNVSSCDFNFSEDYTDDLVKIAVFTRDGLTYKCSIVDDSATIPIEILDKTGTLTIGVYAYSVVNNELVKRFSPKPITIKIDVGSYMGNAQNGTAPTPSEYDRYVKLLNDGLKGIQKINITAVKENNVATITITDKNGATTTFTISDGEKGDTGEKGDNTPVKGVDYWTEEDKSEIVNDVLDQLVDAEEVDF